MQGSASLSEDDRKSRTVIFWLRLKKAANAAAAWMLASLRSLLWDRLEARTCPGGV